MYTITFAQGESKHHESHFQRRNVSEERLLATLASYQVRGCRIVRVEEQN